MDQLRAVVARVRRIPIVQGLVARRHRRRFLSEAGAASHYGVYRTFAEARADAPASREFDRVESAGEYADRVARVFPYDYPVLFWLDRALREGCRTILDVGGSIGVHYFAYQRWIRYPPDVRWTVCEVPAIAAAGRSYAAERGATALEFTTELSRDAVARADVLVSAGSLHYIEGPRLEQLLPGGGARPRHILLNKVPLYDGDEFVSLQNIRGAFAPHWVFNRDRLVSDVASRGYELVDAWKVLERSFWLPGHPERSFGHYSGVYLRAAGGR